MAAESGRKTNLPAAQPSKNLYDKKSGAYKQWDG
jgi:hypothetical protein